MSHQPPSPLRQAVVAMARRQMGVATDEVQGATVRQVARVLQHLTDSGQAVAMRWTPRCVRYFVHPADGEAWLDAKKLSAATQAVRVRIASTQSSATNAPWPADAPIHWPVDSDGVPTWKFTRCPSSRIGLTRTNTYHEDH